METTGGWGSQNHHVTSAFNHAAALLHKPPPRWWQPLLSFTHRRALLQAARAQARKSIPRMASSKETDMSHFDAKEFVQGAGGPMAPFEATADLDASDGLNTETHCGWSSVAIPAFSATDIVARVAAAA